MKRGGVLQRRQGLCTNSSNLIATEIKTEGVKRGGVLQRRQGLCPSI